MNWQEIIKFLGSATLFASVVAYLGKKAIDAFFSGRLEKYKGDLQRVTSEHAIQFQRLHAERAEVIKDFYEKFAQLDSTLATTLSRFVAAGEPELPEKISQLAREFNDLKDFFQPRRIFFAESLCTLVDKVLGLAKGIFFDITTYEIDPRHPQYKFDKSLLVQRSEFWNKARVVHENDFSKLKSTLENEFRTLLGINV